MSPLLDIGLSPRLSSERFRYQQPKRFWATLFAGSVGLHLAAAFLAPAMWRSFVPESQGTGTGAAPTPVELIDASELGGVALNDAANSADPALATAPAVEAPSAVPQPAPATSLPQTVPQPFTPQPNPSFSDAAPVSPQPPADFSNAPDPTPLPQNPLPSQNTPVQQPQPGQNTPVQQPQPNQGIPSTFPGEGSSVQVGRPLPSPGYVPDPSDYAGDTGSSEGGADVAGTDEGTPDGLPDVGTPQQAPPRRGVANLTPGNASLPGAIADAPEVPPQPLQTQLDITSDPTEPNPCLITPDSVNSFGETLSFNLVIDTEGRVAEVYDEQVSSNPAYTDLGRCVVRNWTFTPARTGDVLQQSNLIVTLSIQPAL